MFLFFKRSTYAWSGSVSSNTFLFYALIVLVLFSQVVLFVCYLVVSVLAYVLSLFGFNALRRYLARKKQSILPTDKALLLWLLTPSGRFTGSGGGSFSGGGFSGGGGSFGGGGSSGRW